MYIYYIYIHIYIYTYIYIYIYKLTLYAFFRNASYIYSMKRHSEHFSYMTVCFYHVTYAFQSESTLCSCLNVKELLARSRREI